MYYHHNIIISHHTLYCTSSLSTLRYISILMYVISRDMIITIFLWSSCRRRVEGGRQPEGRAVLSAVGMWRSFKEFIGLSENRSRSRSRENRGAGGGRSSSSSSGGGGTGGTGGGGRAGEVVDPPIPELPDFWKPIRSQIIACILEFATREELKQLERCQVKRIATCCSLEAARRDRVLSSMVHSARAFASLVTPGTKSEELASPKCVLPSRAAAGDVAGNVVPGLTESALEQIANAIVEKSSVGERFQAFARDDVAEFLTVLNAVCRSSKTVFGRARDQKSANEGTWSRHAVSVIGYAYWRIVSMSQSSRLRTDNGNEKKIANLVPANMTVHRQAHVSALWAAEMIAGSWEKFVERLQHVFLNAEEKDVFLQDRDATDDRPRARNWSFADIRPFVEHRRLVCTISLMQKLADADRCWNDNPMSLTKSLQDMLESEKQDTLPWYGVGSVICYDVWVAMYLHFDRLIPPPTFFQEVSPSSFSEDLVMSIGTWLNTDAQITRKKEEDAATGREEDMKSVPNDGQDKKSDSESQDDVAMSPRSKSRIKKLETLNDSVTTTADEIDNIEKSFNDEAMAAAQYYSTEGPLQSDLVRERATIAKIRLAGFANDLAQVYGNLEKLQFTKVDAIITADLVSGRIDAKQKRKGLTKSISALMERVISLRKQVELERSSGASRKK